MAIIPGNTGTTTKAVDGIEGATSGAPVSLPSGFSGPSQRPFSAADADLTMTVATHGGLVSMTPTAARVVTLPSTSVYTGYSVEVINLSSAQNININASGGGQVYILSGGQSVKLLSTTAAPTLPGQWAVSTAGSGSGLNEQPVKNYLQAIATAVASAGTLSTVAPNGSVTTSAWFSHVTTPFTMVQDTSTPLRGTASYLSATNTGASSDGSVFFQLPRFQLELADRGKPVSLSLDITGVTAANQWDVVVVRYNNAGAFQELIPVAGTASNASGVAANGLGVPSAQVPSGLATMRGFFVPASDDSYYAVRFRRLSGSTQIEFDTLYVGPQVQLSGAAVTDWQSYTPTVANITTGTNNARWRRNGDSLDLMFTFTKSGAGAGAIAIELGLPSGLTIDSTKLSNAGGTGVKGYANRFINATNVWENTVLFPTVTGLGAISLARGGGATYLRETDLATSDAVNVFVQGLPVSNWSSNTTMAERAVEEYAFNTGSVTTAGGTDTSSFGNGANGTPVLSINSNTTNNQTNFRVRFQSPIQATDRIEVEFQSASGAPWLPAGPAGLLGGSRLNLAIYGVEWGRVSGSTTDIDVKFGNAGASSYNTGATYGSTNGDPWSGYTAFRWRVRKVSGGAVVGYPVGVQNIWNQVPTVLDFDDFIATDLIGTTLNAPARTIVEAGTGNISVSAISAGTVTFTFNEAGKYKVEVNNSHRHGAAYSNSVVICTFGGTASRYGGNSNSMESAQEPAGDRNGNGSCFLWVIATAAQTLTVSTTFSLTGSGATSNHVAKAGVLIQRIA